MNLPPLPPQDDDPIITQFEPQDGQWGLTEDNINRIDPETGYTILHNYCEYINSTPFEVYRYLIETKGCDVNVQDNNNETPLLIALFYFNPNNGSNLTILTYLLSQNKFNGNIKGQYGYTILHWACYYINILPVDVFKVLIETMGCDVNAQDDDKDTPIHFALRCFDPNDGGDITVLRYLLTQRNTNVNTKGENGRTLLHSACFEINNLSIDVFKLLIDTMGCDVNVQNDDNDTPLHLALRYFDPNDGGDMTVLMYLLNQNGVNGNIKGVDGNTILHYACGNINNLPLDIFEVLLETVGCDVNIQNNDNDTPVHLAFSSFNQYAGGNITVLTYLLTQKGVDVNIKGHNGNTLLHTACEKMNRLPLDVFKFLIETMGFDVNAQDDDNNTPIQNALCCFDPDYGDINVLTYLLNQNNVNLNIKNEKGCNLLHTTCINTLPSNRRSVELDAEYDTVFCQIVEMIAERCIQQVLDENNLE
jgi:ankyrin repeat protein